MASGLSPEAEALPGCFVLALLTFPRTIQVSLQSSCFLFRFWIDKGFSVSPFYYGPSAKSGNLGTITPSKMV